MKLVAFTCPSCGAHLDVDVDNKTATCQFCGATFPVDDETQHLKFDGAAQAGYEFEKGRQRAQAEAYAQQTAAPVQQPVHQPEPPKKKRKTWLWVLGWLLIFPVPLTIIMLRKKEMNPIARYGIIVVGWLVYLSIGLAGGGEKSENKTKDTADEAVAAQEAAVEDKESAPEEESSTPAVEPEPQQQEAEESAQVEEAPSETVSQKNAVRKAKSYLDFAPFSHDGLVSQLKYDGFSDEDAVYGADNCGADWFEQAAKKAETYLDFSAFSHDSLVKQLEYDKFTPEQAEYGVSQVGL